MVDVDCINKNQYFVHDTSTSYIFFIYRIGDDVFVAITGMPKILDELKRFLNQYSHISLKPISENVIQIESKLEYEKLLDYINEFFNSSSILGEEYFEYKINDF